MGVSIHLRYAVKKELPLCKHQQSLPPFYKEILFILTVLLFTAQCSQDPLEQSVTSKEALFMRMLRGSRKIRSFRRSVKIAYIDYSWHLMRCLFHADPRDVALINSTTLMMATPLTQVYSERCVIQCSCIC